MCMSQVHNKQRQFEAGLSTSKVGWNYKNVMQQQIHRPKGHKGTAQQKCYQQAFPTEKKIGDIICAETLKATKGTSLKT